MAEDKKNVVDLTEEEKLLEAQELPNKIAELINTLQANARDKGFAADTYREVMNVDGLSGVVARMLTRQKIDGFNKQQETLLAALGDAKVRRMEVATSLFENFQRDDTRPLDEEQVRLEQLELEALRSLNDAFRDGFISSGEYSTRLDNLQRAINDPDLHDAGSAANTASDETLVKRMNEAKDALFNFTRDKDKTTDEEQKRYDQLEINALKTLQTAFSNRAITGAEYADQLGVLQSVIADAKLHDVDSGENAADRYGTNRTKADAITGNWAAGISQRMGTMMRKGVMMFGPQSPVMRRAGAFFRGGRFSLAGGLRAMGPWGAAAAGAYTTGKAYYNFNKAIAKQINANVNNALMSGLDLPTMKSLGVGLGAYGGTEAEVLSLTGGIARTLGGLKYGGNGGNMFNAARLYGIDITGSGYGGLATTEEYLYSISRYLAANQNMTKEELAYFASVVGISSSQYRMLKDGPDKFAERLHQADWITKQNSTPEKVKDAEESSAKIAELEAVWEVVKQGLVNGTFTRAVAGAGIGLGTSIDMGVNASQDALEGVLDTVGLDGEGISSAIHDIPIVGTALRAGSEGVSVLKSGIGIAANAVGDLVTGGGYSDWANENIEAARNEFAKNVAEGNEWKARWSAIKMQMLSGLTYEGQEAAMMKANQAAEKEAEKMAQGSANPNLVFYKGRYISKERYEKLKDEGQIEVPQVQQDYLAENFDVEDEERAKRRRERRARMRARAEGVKVEETQPVAAADGGGAPSLPVQGGEDRGATPKVERGYTDKVAGGNEPWRMIDDESRAAFERGEWSLQKWRKWKLYHKHKNDAESIRAYREYLKSHREEGRIQDVDDIEVENGAFDKALDGFPTKGKDGKDNDLTKSPLPSFVYDYFQNTPDSISNRILPETIMSDNSTTNNEVNIEVQKVEVASTATSYTGVGEDIGKGLVDAAAPAARRAILNEFGGSSGMV